jgi:hypothetical protein
MVLGYELRADQRATMLRVLRANTMLVRGHRSFSHDEFRRVVYAKYIRTPDQHVLLHTLMVSECFSYCCYVQYRNMLCATLISANYLCFRQ